eukprot:751121-Hanusia_phi.AAC.2
MVFCPCCACCCYGLSGGGSGYSDGLYYGSGSGDYGGGSGDGGGDGGGGGGDSGCAGLSDTEVVDVPAEAGPLPFGEEPDGAQGAGWARQAPVM